MLEGSNDKNDPMQALAWTRSYRLPGGRRGRAFCTTMGSSTDLENAGLRRLLVNAVHWCLGMEIPEEGEVAIVDSYQPTAYESRKRAYWGERGLEVSDFALATPFRAPAAEVQGVPGAPYLDLGGGREGYGYDYAGHPANTYRLYNFYDRQAEYFLDQEKVPEIIPRFPDLDGGTGGHWGSYHKNSYRDRRWNLMDFGRVFSGVLRVNPSIKANRKLAKSGALTRAVAVDLGEGLFTAFDAETLRYAYLWKDRFISWDPGRWGIGKGIAIEGEILGRSEKKAGWSFTEGLFPTAFGEGEAEYFGHYRIGDRVIFHYSVGGVEIYDSPKVILGADGSPEVLREIQFVDRDSERLSRPLPLEGMRVVESSLLEATAQGGGAPHWADYTFTAAGELGKPIPGSPFVIDRIPVPLQNEFGSVMLIGGHDFFTNGDAAVCTISGDVWRVSGLDAELANVRWKRIASGLNQALGLCISDGELYVLGRDRINRLHDLNGDGEIDFYENFADGFPTSEGGHDFYTGLQRDGNGNFYFVAAKHGMIRVSPDGKKSEIIATGLRNANGVGASPVGSIVTTSTNEGNWTPASAVLEVRDGDFFGLGAAKGDKIAPALCYLPRGIDNSSGGQVFAQSEAWGPLGDKL
ncbi:MAG: DUF6797 domain-containing protein, partial [Verrucomicrobiales bacterium]